MLANNGGVMQNRLQFFNSLQVNKKPTYGRNNSCNLFTWNCEIDINRFDANANKFNAVWQATCCRLNCAKSKRHMDQKYIYRYKFICDAMSS